MTTLTIEELNKTFEKNTFRVSDSWQDLPDLFKYSVEKNFRWIIDIVSDPTIFSTGRESFYFFAYRDNKALVGYQPSQCISAVGPRVAILRKDQASNIHIEEIEICTGMEFRILIAEIVSMGKSSTATEEEKKSSTVVFGKATALENAQWHFKTFKEITRHKMHDNRDE